MGNIFISYAKEDKNQIMELYEALKGHGFSVWLDHMNLLPGQEWKSEIEKAIRESEIFIACLSKNSVNKKGFVQAELKRALEITELMPEGTIYIIPIRIDECKVPAGLSKWQWLDYFDADEKDRLFKAIRSRTSSSNNTFSEKEMFFDAGARIAQLRNELGLKTSEFAEILNISSQREYERMERQESEVPLSLLKRISETSGIQLDWLKHQSGDRYKVEYISLRGFEEDLNYLASLHPEEYFLTLDKKYLHVGLVAQTGKYRYQVFDISTRLNFWNWIDDYWAIPAFYHFLKKLSDPWHSIDGLILPSSFQQNLYGGEIHFLTASRNAEMYGKDLLYDILDLDETNLQFSRSYTEDYGGKWMHKVHIEIKKYLKIGENRKANATSKNQINSKKDTNNDSNSASM